MARRNISGGSQFEEIIGYSRVVDDGDYVFVSGTAGFDYEKGTISDDVEDQVRQTFRNLTASLATAGCRLVDVVKATYIVSDRDNWQKIIPVIGEHMRDVRPTATAFIASLVDDRMKVEIEVVARRPDR